MRRESFLLSIEQRYGNRLKKLIEFTQFKVAKIIQKQNNVKFLKRCRDNNLVPHGLRVKKSCGFQQQNIRCITEKLERAMLRSELRRNRSDISRNCKIKESTREIIKNNLEISDYLLFEKFVKDLEYDLSLPIKERQIRKFEKLIEERDILCQEQKNKRDDFLRMRRSKIRVDVVDLTKNQELDSDQKAYLALGPDFCETPKRIPYEKVICETEKMCQMVKKKRIENAVSEVEIENELTKIRSDCDRILSQQMKTKLISNLTEEEKRGKMKIIKDENNVYLPADKGRVMVAMSRYERVAGEESYEYKMKNVLKDLKAEPSIRANSDYDPTEKVCRNIRPIIKEMVEKDEISVQKGKYLQPSECHAPRLSGYPKIHKIDKPLRGVVSTVSTPFDRVSKLLVPILRSLQGRTGLFVKNSRELKTRVGGWRVERNEILVSYDVKNLYPSIPVKEALELVEVLLKGKADILGVTSLSVQSIMKLLKWTFGLFYCEFEGEHYILNSGPIGLGATGEIAIIYMEEFQLHCLNTLPYSCLKQWQWYVDDSELKTTRDEAHKILNDINDIEPGVIVFTIEEQQNDVLPVLDLKQTIDRKTKSVNFGVHYKETHTNLNINARSNHPMYMKRGIIKGFTERAKALCDEDSVAAELQNIEDVFVANEYPRAQVKQMMADSIQEPTEEREPDREEYIGQTTMPYVEGLSERYKRLAKKHNFQVSFTPGSKLKSVKLKCQEPLGNKRNNVVYQIPCECGAIYTGETKRRFGTRLEEHRTKVRLTLNDIENGNQASADARMGKEDGGLARHATSCNNIKWEDAKVVASEAGWRQRKVREGIETCRVRSNGGKPLNISENLLQWRYTLHKCFSPRK